VERALVAACVFGFVSISAHAAPPADALNQIEAKMHKEGPRAVLQAIWNTPQFEYVLDGVASGKSGWFEIGLELIQISDAGATSMLRESFALALVRSPVKVLIAQADGKLASSIEALCRSPFVDEPPVGFRAFFNAAEKSLTRVKDQRVVQLRDQCLENLRKGRELYLTMSNSPSQPTPKTGAAERTR
jgi:hypothetical protein